ncbi:Dual specificity protein phosphatase 26 [Porphyridium purpureum]|uniref:protein-tyrosine-phosphatase n=1 Tax=Porphyridium purpureum TaxID=35688 RepID=A0A5J4YYJ1_PORPP|nr:Dual specificity protein phosphatase 26 [Porphyridium purpureum]|eukprot:POR2668..scf209_3
MRASPVTLCAPDRRSAPVAMHSTARDVHPQWRAWYEARAQAVSALLDAEREPRSGPWKVRENLILGNIFHAKDTRVLRRLGVTHVLNMATERTDTDLHFYSAPETSVVSFLRVPAYDTESFDLLSEVIPSCVSFIDEAINQYPQGRVFVHCYAGVNRSVAVIVAYLMQIERSNLIDAIEDLWSKRGSRILSNGSFQRQLVQFELALQLQQSDQALS